MTTIYVWPPEGSSDFGRKPVAVEVPGDTRPVHARAGKQWRARGEGIEYPAGEVDPHLNECRLRVHCDEIVARREWPKGWRWLHSILYALWLPYRVAVRRNAWLIAVVEYGVDPALASRFVSRRVSSREWFVDLKAQIEGMLYGEKD